MDHLSEEERNKLSFYLNFDMIASPNYINDIYDVITKSLLQVMARIALKLALLGQVLSRNFFKIILQAKVKPMKPPSSMVEVAMVFSL